MSLTVGTDTWLSLADANTYMEGRYGASQYWDDLSDSNREAALKTAYKQIKNSNMFTFPSTTSQAMKDAQCEQALFIVQHQADIDMRMGLQQRGVLSAGIVKETYDQAMRNQLVFSPAAMRFLDSIKKYGSALYIGELERDEDEDVE